MNNTEDQFCYNHRVEVFTPKGQFLRVFKFLTNFHFTLHHPVGIVFASDGPFLISSYDGHCVFMFEEDGSLHPLLMVHVHKRKRFTHPHGVLVIDYGQIMIASGRLLV